MLKVRRNGRKGFTLAELLIVVAIIAVLVAIAVPLFVTSLNKAAKVRDAANVRAIRGAAVAAILGLDPATSADKTKYETIFDDDGTLMANVVATAKIDESGSITELTIKVGSGDEEEGAQGNGTYLAKISSLDLNASFSGAGTGGGTGGGSEVTP